MRTLVRRRGWRERRPGLARIRINREQQEFGRERAEIDPAVHERLRPVLAGIRVQRQTMYLYVLLGIACGIAAVMIMARTTTGTSTHGTLYELDAIAAVVIGGTLLTGGRGTIIGTVLGVLIFTTLTNVFTLNNLDTSTQAVAKGAIIVAAVLLQQRVARPAKT